MRAPQEKRQTNPRRRSLAGTRIRERRLRRGIAQAALATQVGISPSYLNLIEHNRRAVAGGLLLRLAEALGTSPSALSEHADEALIGDLRQAAAVAEGEAAEIAQMDELVGRMPGWARLLAALYRRTRDQDAVITALSDRLSHDPFLGESVHAMRTTIAAIRSSSALLTQLDDIPAQQKQRFLSAIHEESVRLSSVAEALATYFEQSAAAGDVAATPEETADNFLSAHNHRFPELDAAAEQARADDPVTDAALQGTVDAMLAQADLPQAAAAVLARHLMAYASDARAMPLNAFAEAAEQLAYDPAHLAQRFNQPLEAVFRRLASLRRDGIDAPLMGLVTVTASGYPLYRAPLPAFPIPRHGNACQLWPLFHAFTTPGRPIIARLQHDNTQEFAALAIASGASAAGFGRPQNYTASMLIVPATATPYKADGEPLLVGTSCRICSREGCPARTEPRLME